MQMIPPRAVAVVCPDAHPLCVLTGEYHFNSCFFALGGSTHTHNIVMMVKDEECVFKMAMSSVVEEVPGRRLKRRVRLPISKRAREMIAAQQVHLQCKNRLSDTSAALRQRITSTRMCKYANN